MRITSLRIGLPGLEQDAVDQLTSAVEHPAFDPNALAFGVRRHHIVGDQLLPFVLRLAHLGWSQAEGSERTDRLRRRDAGHHIFLLSIILSENRFPPSGQARGQAFPDHAQSLSSSSGVAFLPRSTMSKRYASAHS